MGHAYAHIWPYMGAANGACMRAYMGHMGAANGACMRAYMAIYGDSNGACMRACMGHIWGHTWATWEQ